MTSNRPEDGPTDAERDFIAEYLAKKEMADLARLRASHDTLLAVAKWADGLLNAIGNQTGIPPNVHLSKALQAAADRAEKIRVMTFDNWKTTEPDDGAERPEPGETELELLYAREARLRASHDALLAAAKAILPDTSYTVQSKIYRKLQAAIAKAEELAQ
jgi:hypothetical protein